MMVVAFTQRREYLFLYTVKDANPNGNPLEENHPRYDEDTQQAMASDVRIKRTIRDQWIGKGYNVFIDGEAKSLKTRFEELKSQLKKDDARQVLRECIDARLFGATFTLGKETFSWTGPVQFKWARSLHAASFEFIQGTAAFATEHQNVDRQQRSFRNEYIVPFALMAVYGIANQYASEDTGATDEDLQAMLEALWEGTDNLITRSKNEHKARLAIEITYKQGFDGKIGGLDEKLGFFSAEGEELSMDEQKAIRSLSQVLVDIGPLTKMIADKSSSIDKVKVILDSELNLKGDDELRRLDFVGIEMR